MNLTEWKNANFQRQRDQIKVRLREDTDVREIDFPHYIVREIEEEMAIEDFAETVSFEEEFDFENVHIDPETNVMEAFEFIPDENGSRMDLEFEIQLEDYNPSYVALGKIRDMLFAEDYEIEIDEAANRAKVTFKRSGGQISKKKVCPKGMKLKGNRCIPQGGSQKSKMKVMGIKLKRAKKAMGAGKKKKAAIKAKTTKRRVGGKSRNYSGT